jgi:hypothetical protein
MQERQYVISIKRIKNYKGEPIEGEFNYAGLDTHAGSLSTGYPIFCSWVANAERFSSVEEAKKWWETNSKHMLGLNVSHYDMSTLAIRKIIYKTFEKLEYHKE